VNFYILVYGSDKFLIKITKKKGSKKWRKKIHLNVNFSFIFSPLGEGKLTRKTKKNVHIG